MKGIMIIYFYDDVSVSSRPIKRKSITNKYITNDVTTKHILERDVFTQFVLC